MILLKLIWLIYILAGMVLTLYGISLFMNVIYFILTKRIPASSIKFGEFEPPYVTIAVPVYNESQVIGRLLTAISKFEYPADNLQILILDDSTDETSRIIDAFIAGHQNSSPSITLFRREERSDYKTGALRNSMQFVHGEFIAVFDADFVPAPDFLKNALPHFQEDEKIGFIQARWGYTNAQQSLITIVQSISLDTHFGLEKPLEHEMGLFINYNGSAGVWRKAAILDCGGWPQNALSEDLELSFRAQARGWRGLYLSNIVVPSELASSLSVLALQQERWAYGGLQVFRKLWKDIARARTSLARRVHAFSILLGFLVFDILALLPVLFLALKLFSRSPISELPLVVPVLALIIAHVSASLAALQKTYSNWGSRAAYLPMYILIIFGLSLRIGWGAIKGLLGVPHEFIRTPKMGGDSEVRGINISREGLFNHLVEILIAALMIYGAFLLRFQVSAGSIFTLMLFAVSYLLVVSLAICEQIFVRRMDA